MDSCLSWTHPKYCEVFYDQDSGTYSDMGNFSVTWKNCHRMKNQIAYLPPQDFLFLISKLPDGLAKIESLTPEELAKEDESVVWTMLISNHGYIKDYTTEIVLEVSIENHESHLYLRDLTDDNDWYPEKVRFDHGDEACLQAIFKEALLAWYKEHLTNHPRAHYTCNECFKHCQCAECALTFLDVRCWKKVHASQCNCGGCKVMAEAKEIAKQQRAIVAADLT